MPIDDDQWTQFDIRVYTDPAAGDARRVVFESRGRVARRQVRPASVVLRAGGELLVRYDPPAPEIAGFTRDDFLTKAAAMVRWMSRA